MSERFDEFFQNRRVLVTGDTGFKGSWLALWLHDLGAQVCGVALPPERNEDHFVTARLRDRIRHVDGDIRDPSTLADVIAEWKPEIVFHLAAQALVRRSYLQPRRTFETNVLGSVNLLEAVRQMDCVRAVIYVTSDKCYRNREWVWGYRESDELGGTDPYSASKAAAEIVREAYEYSFFKRTPAVGVASVRAGNVIGGGDWAEDRLVPDTIRALIEERPIRLRHPDSTRPWQHVLDPLGGYLLLARRLVEEPQGHSGAWNFGPGTTSSITVRDLVKAVLDQWGGGEIEDLSKTPRADQYPEATVLNLNCDKANLKLGWYPRLSVAESVGFAVDWYRSVHQGAAADDCSLQQIRRYPTDPQG